MRPTPTPELRGRVPFARGLARFVDLDAAELGDAAVLALHALLLMVIYYALKTVREPLLLAGGSAELKSYANGVIAAVLLALVPCFASLIRRTDTSRLLERVTLAFAATLAAFCALGRAGVDVGFAYYVWVGVFGVTILAQFWSHAARRYDAERGGRSVPFVMAGAAVGGLLGPVLCARLFPLLGAWRLLDLGALLLAATVPLAASTRSHAPASAAGVRGDIGCGLRELLGNRQLRLIAALVVIVNCVNSTGEYLLTTFVLHDADLKVAADPTLDRAALVAGFYAHYFFRVNVLTVLLQLVFVRQTLLAIGVRGTIVFAPLIAALGYGLVAFVPMFAALRAVKLLENSVDYSLMNTVRQVLYLDLPPTAQHQGRSAIETFCYRLGDLLQAAVVAVGTHVLKLAAAQFAWLNAGLAILWLAIAATIGRSHPRVQRRRFAFAWQSLVVAACCTASALIALWSPVRARADEAPTASALGAPSADLFAADEPLTLTIELDVGALCRDAPNACAAPITVGFIDESGTARRLRATAVTRGQWRVDRANCSVPPLFVVFDRAAAEGTPFAAHERLPLTTHCRAQARYEQYLLKEYLAYRIYGVLSDASLRVRLVRVAYTLGGAKAPLVRYAFFTENFATLAARRDATVAREPGPLARLDERELATLELYEYLIGNTDWSIVRGHNVAELVGSDGALTAVPYDFDFSGLVDAAYATPPERLPIRSVTERLFRGFCRPGFDWQPVIAAFVARRGAIEALIAETPGLSADGRAWARAFVAEFYALAADPAALEDALRRGCRARI